MSEGIAILQGIAAALDGLDVAMCTFDLDDRTLVWNRAFLRYFPEHADHIHAGEPYRENLRRFYQGRLDPKELASIERYIEDGLARHRVQYRPYNFKHRGVWLRVASVALNGIGRVRIWSRDTVPWLGDTDEPNPLPPAVNLADNTELFEHMGEGVMLADADNRITWVNEHLVRMFALPNKQAAIDARIEDLYRAVWRGHPDAAAATLETGLSRLAENLRFAGAPFELPLPGKRWVRVVEQRRRDGVGFFALVDITQLKRQQQELIVAESRARQSQAELADKSRLLEATLERMEQGVMMVNAERVVELCNRRAIELLGLPAALMASRPKFSQVLAHQWATDEFVYTSQEMKDFIRSGGIQEQPQCYDRKRPNGQVIEVLSVPIQGGGILRTYTDITARKRAEATQRVLEAQLREAQKLEAIGTLAGGIAHDFNNILAAILGNVALVRDELGPGSAASGYLEQINKAGRRARSLVQQILAFSNQQPNEFVNLALQPLVQETVTMLRATLGAAARLSTHLPEESLGVMGNPTQLQQVLMNLGTNAWQALHNGAGTVELGLERVRVGAQAASLASGGLAPGEHVHLWVRDDGHGMDAATRERIFEPFFTTKPVGQGTGLGLAVVHGIIEAHGGSIVVDSAPGRGSTFHVYLPLVEHASGPTPLDAIEPTPLRGSGQHVLYVDDDDVMAMMVSGLLTRLGYRASTSLDAQQAIDLVADAPGAIDLVVTDFNMPNRTGLDVVRALAAIRPDLPVVISSGYISEALRASATQLGVAGLMQKEHTLEELGRVVHAALHPAPDPAAQ